jgi:hypothetical protein
MRSSSLKAFLLRLPLEVAMTTPEQTFASLEWI